jgi:ribosomal protein S12 methylthiotransferase
MLPELLKRLAAIPGINWIRIQYCYPEEITDELIETIRTEPKVCHYLDIPIQHCSDRVLKRMGRKTNQKELREMIEKLRREIPDISLRTTLIAGFPGETEEDHQEMMELQQEISLDKAEARVGTELEVIVEGKVADESVYIGRSYMDAPGVDGYVFIYTDEELMSGQFVDVRITGASEYDLIGELIDESAQ